MLDEIPSRLIGLLQVTLVTIGIYFYLHFKKLYITPDNLLQVESKIVRYMDLALMEYVSTDTCAMTDLTIQPLQNQASLWGLHDEVSVVNARQASSGAASVMAFQIFSRKFLVPRKTDPLKPRKSCNMGLRDTYIIFFIKLMSISARNVLSESGFQA